MKDHGQVQSAKQDPLSFSKMSGGGNDFVVIDNRTGRVTDPAELATKICTRALSVGADGLILVEASARSTFRMRYFNSDGSLGAFCGNGTRCAARFAFMNVIAGRRMTIETDAGIVAAEIGDGGAVTLNVPPPYEFRPHRPLVIGDRTVQGTFLMVGVPHYVMFVSSGLWEADIRHLGYAIRMHPDLQPAGTNVNFVSVRSDSAIDVRTWERGVEAETMACGSGVVASAVTSAFFGRVRPPVAVRTRSGLELEVAFRMAGGYAEDVRLKGDARLIYRASLTPETVEGFDPAWVRSPGGASVAVP